MRTDRYRYTEWVKFIGEPTYKPDWNVLFGVELYDHEFDPAENINRALDGNFATVKEELSRQLRKGWRAATIPARL